MPFYQCPKCGGRNTYQGTELVSGSKGGGAIIGPENDLGFSPVMNTGGKKTIDQVTVVKCKSCDIILGDKDLHLTAEEVANEKKEFREHIARKVKNSEGFGEFLTVLSFVIIIAVIGALIYITFK
jgi:hypothetical protein